MSFGRLVDPEDRGALSDAFDEEFHRQPEVGVGLLNYNGISDTITCCESVVESTELPTLLTIVENGSETSQKEQLFDELDRRTKRRAELHIDSKVGNLTATLFEWDTASWVLVADSDTNLGFCTGNNLAVEFFDYLDVPHSLVLNNDAELRENCLERLRETITAMDDVVAVSPVIYDHDDELWYAGGTYSKWDYRYKDDFDDDGEGYVSRISQDDAYRTDLYSGACVLFDTAVYCDEGGMYDPLFISIDEPEFSRHLREQGHSIAVEPRAEAVHQRNETLGPPGSTLHDYFYVRNFMIYSYVHNSRLDHAAFFARQFLNYVRPFLEGGSSSRSNRAMTGVDAIVDYFRGQWGPGRLWDELNTTRYDNPLWDPDSSWNRNRR